MPRKYDSEKSGFLRLHHRMARKQTAAASAYGSSLRFTLSIAAQKARLTFLNHDIDEKGQRLLRQAMNAAMRKGVHSVECDLRGLRATEEALDRLVSHTRAMLRDHIQIVVLAPEQVAEFALETFPTPKFDPTLMENPAAECPATPLEAAA